MIKIGIAGIGFMGMIHYIAAQKLRGARVEAICTRDPKKLRGDWTDIHGNFGPRGTQMDLSRIRQHASFDALLADSDLDLIDICTPTVHHESMAIAALKAGKHVVVEKPIALTIEAADRMVAAEKAAGKLLFVGHVLPFFPEFALLLDAARGERYGKLLGGQFQRVIAKPDWSAAHSDVAQTGGPAIDLHIHDTHFIRLLCGMPKQVVATGRIEKDAVVHVNAIYVYGEHGPSVACASGALCQKTRPFMHGYEVYFERGTLAFQSGILPPTLYSDTGDSVQVKLPGSGDPVECFAAELQLAVDGIATGKPSPILQGQLARDALVLCQREIESARRGMMLDVA